MSESIQPYKHNISTVTPTPMPGDAGEMLNANFISIGDNFDGLLNPQSPNHVYAGPASGGSGAPGFRALVSADIPGGGGSPGGTTGQIQYNSSGSFAGDTATTDGSGNLSLSSVLFSNPNVDDNTFQFSNNGDTLNIAVTGNGGSPTNYTINFGGAFSAYLFTGQHAGDISETTGNPTLDVSNCTIAPIVSTGNTNPLVFAQAGGSGILAVDVTAGNANSYTDGAGNLTAVSFNGAFVGDGSGLTNLPNPFNQVLNTSSDVTFNSVSGDGSGLTGIPCTCDLSGYASIGDNVSEFTNDAGYLASGADISACTGNPALDASNMTGSPTFATLSATSLAVTGALADGTYPCGTGSVTITNGVITALS